MEITEVRISLRDNPQTRLKAYATVTFDNCFVVRNVKVIEGKSGLFVAMPSQKPKTSCSKCRSKNDLTSRFCVQCGASLPKISNHPNPHPMGEHEASEAVAHRDIAHPITVEFRQYLQKKVIDAYESSKASGAKETPQMPSDSEGADEAL
jgi:stage V sporulation protein G